MNPALLLLALSALLLGPAAASPGLGEPPVAGTAARDLAAAYRLPPLRESRDPRLDAEVAATQVGMRARALGLTAASATDAWSAADALLQSAHQRLATAAPASMRVFAGTTASALNAVLAQPSTRAVRVTSPVLRIDVPVTIRRSDLWLDLGTTELRASDAGPRFALQLIEASRVVVSGGSFRSGRHAVLVDRGRDATLVGMRYAGLSGGGIVVTAAHGTVVARSVFSDLGGAPVLLHGGASGAVVLDNDIRANRGASNWHAGVVVTGRRGDVAADPSALLQADGYWAREQPIREQRAAPRRNLLAFNRIAANASSGVYVDGGIENVLFDNAIEANSKEGVCLDYGATANVLAMNLIRLNGKRWGKTEAELKLDFVAGHGRLADGTPPAKTPGVSLDNALYNIVYANQIDRNYGGGIKMVRTAFFNVVGLNNVTDNNEGASERFHFFGIELGAARADAPAADLDFAASRGNIVFGNSVRGSHYAGLFFGDGSTQNDAFDNTIFGATNWAIEQPREQANATLNNLTNLPSRNIDAGLDPRLGELSKRRAP